MADVVREDVVKVGFDIDLKTFSQLQKDVDELKKKLTGDMGGDAFDDLKDSTNGAKSSMDKAKKSANALGTSLSSLGKKAAATAYNGLKKVAGISFKALTVGTGAATAATIKFSQMASDLEETKNKVDVAFGSGFGNFDGAASDVMEWSKTSTTSMGLAQQTALDTAALFGDMGTSMGLAKNEAAEMSMALTQQAADLASFMNMNIEEVTTALNGVFTGETESLKRLGVVMTEVNLENYALEKGIGKTLDQMSEAEKVQLRYNYVMEKTKNATGDYQRTGGGFANQLRTLTENFKQLGTTLGALPMKKLAGGMKVINSALADIQDILSDGFQEGDLEKIFDIVDGLVDTGIKALEKALPDIIPKITDVLSKIFGKLVDFIPKAAPAIAAGIVKLMVRLGKVIIDNRDELLNAAKEVVGAVINAVYEEFTGKTIDWNILDGLKEKIGDLLPVIGGLAAAFIGLKKVRSIGSALSGLFGKRGNKGSGGDGGIFSGLANIKTKTLLKSILNLGIIIGGLTLLAVVFVPIAKELAKEADIKLVLEAIGIIGALGVVGTALAKLAGTVGKIKISSVAKGLANIAIIVTGMGALLWIATQAFKGGVDFGEMLKVIALTGILGAVGAGIAKLAGIAGKVKVSTVAKGLANMAIVVAGMGALLWIATKVFKDGVDFGEMIKVTVLIGILGTVGSVLAVFAGLVGMIPFPAVLSGLANIALVLGGLTAIIEVFGALSQIPFFNDFLEKGGEVLTKITNILGDMIGSFIGGIGEGLTDSLPAIGQNIADFAENLQPAFAIFNGVDLGSVGDFLAAMGAFFLTMAGEKLLSFFTGKTSLADIGTDLSDFAENAEGFFDTLGGRTDYSAITNLFNALSAIKELPRSGGVFQFFAGDQYDGLRELIQRMPELGVAVTAFYNNLGERTDFSAIPNLFNALASVGELPRSGGVFQFFAGDQYDGLKELIQRMPELGVSITSFYNNLGERTDFSAIPNLFNALASVGELPKAGGVFQFFSGDQYDGLKELIQSMPELGAAITAFYNNLGDRTDFSAIPSLFNALSSVDELPNDSGVLQFFAGNVYTALEKMVGLLPKLGTSVESFFGAISDVEDFGKMPELFEAIGSLGDYIDSDGGFFDSIGDFFSGDEKNALESIGESLGTFGTNTKDFFASVSKLNLSNLNGLWDSLEKATVISDDVLITVDANVSDLVSKISGLPGQMAQGLKESGYTLTNALVSIWRDAVRDSAVYINRLIEGANWVFKAFGAEKRIAAWEPYAKGTSGHGGGNALVNDGRGAELIQMPGGNAFIPSGRNVLIPNAPIGMRVLSAEQTALLMGRKTPTFQYANGIPKNWLNISLGNEASASAWSGSTSGTSVYTPENTTAAVNHHTETNVYSPQFTLNISGTGDDRAAARKVKRWIQEALDETFDSMARKNPRLQEI